MRYRAIGQISRTDHAQDGHLNSPIGPKYDTTSHAPARDGTLTLAGANTYTGPTLVTTGMLAIVANGALGQGDTTVQGNVSLTLATGVTAAHNNAPGATLSLALTSTINLKPPWLARCRTRSAA